MTAATVDGIVGQGALAVVTWVVRDRDGLQPRAGKPVEVTVGHHSTLAWTITLSAYMLLNGVAEELYFRGWLLPRLGRLGRWAPLANVFLLSLCHVWLPAQLLSRLAAILPVGYVVRWRRNVYLGTIAHIALNAVASSLLIAAIDSDLSACGKWGWMSGRLRAPSLPRQGHDRRRTNLGPGQQFPLWRRAATPALRPSTRWGKRRVC